MGFGFNLLFVFIIIPVSGILIVLWLTTGKSIYGKGLGLLYAGVTGIVVLGYVSEMRRAKILLEKKDFYGSYTIDRTFFPGMQAAWQYNSFRIEILKNDSLYFHVTEGQRILKTYRGLISTVKPYNSARLVIKMTNPTHHILSSNPTIYRGRNSFCLVFNSPKFGNVFFSKGEWKPLDSLRYQ
jgi:hypothetical protein